MEIRKANNNDLEQLIQLMIEFKDGLTDFEPEDLKVFRRKIKSIDLIKKSVKEEIDNPNGLFLVAEDENKLVGFAVGTTRENIHLVYDTVKSGMLNHIWITNNYRGRGLASKFKDNLVQW